MPRYPRLRIGGAVIALLMTAACRSNEAAGTAWIDLFAGAPTPTVYDLTLPAGWAEAEFGATELAYLEDGAVVLEQGVPLAGATWTGEPPRPPYELEVEFERRNGTDFPLALTFPVREAHLTLVLGGWGGVVSGLSSLDGEDASENETRFLMDFPAGERFLARLTVTDERVVAEVGGERVIDVALDGRVLGLRPEMLPSVPLGIAAFATSSEVHKLRWRGL